MEIPLLRRFYTRFDSIGLICHSYITFWRILADGQAFPPEFGLHRNHAS
jgi:hypothetical protein